MTNEEKALVLSKKLNSQEIRLDGLSYYDHLHKIYKNLKSLGVTDEITLISALLYKPGLSSGELVNQIKNDFPELSKDILETIETLEAFSKSEFKLAQYFDKDSSVLFKQALLLSKNTRVLLIRILQKAENIKSLLVLDSEKRMEAAEKARILYAPLAKILGLSAAQRTLEDESFKVLDPQNYLKVNKLFTKHKYNSQKVLSDFVEKVSDLLTKEGLPFLIHYRIKGKYSTFLKFLRLSTEKTKEIDAVRDVFGVRLLLNTVQDCYHAESLLSGIYYVDPAERDDYIANPKKNGYKSIHTKFIIDKEHETYVEAQIRTHDMHDMNEFGVASHFVYKFEKFTDGVSKTLSFKEFNIVKSQRVYEIEQNNKFIYLYTPKGDIVELEKGSTALDFAYELHEDIGDRFQGVLVNGRMKKMDYVVNNGERIEILNSKKRNVSRDWLNKCKTSKAKRMIRKAVN